MPFLLQMHGIFVTGCVEENIIVKIVEFDTVSIGRFSPE